MVSDTGVRGQHHSSVEPSRHLVQGSGAQEEILLEVLAQGLGHLSDGNPESE